jgi:hypothetical protein
MAIEASCPACNSQLSVPSAGEYTCYSCGQLVNVLPRVPVAGPPVREIATKKKVGESMGAGCVVQIIGLIFLFLFPIGTLLGIVLLVWGHRLSYKWQCSRCGSDVPKEGVVCPKCQATFS